MVRRDFLTTASRTMAATDEELQKLGKPPVHNGKEDVWRERSFVMRSYVSLLSGDVPALLAGKTCDGRHEYDENQRRHLRGAGAPPGP